MKSITSGILKIFYKSKLFDKCAIFMHGSGGLTENNMWYVKLLVKNDYTVVIPDNSLNCKKCIGYSSSYEKLLQNNKMQNLYKKIIKIRLQHINEAFQFLETWCKRYLKNVLLIGTSEGSIVVSRYCNTVYNKYVDKKIIISYSPEKNYYNPTNCPLKGTKDTLYINIIGLKDEYFGSYNSISSKYSKHLKTEVIGNMFLTCLQNGLKCKIYILNTLGHDLTKNKSVSRIIQNLIN